MITFLRAIIIALYAASGLLAAAIVQDVRAERASGRRSQVTNNAAQRIRGLIKKENLIPNDGQTYWFAQPQSQATMRSLLGTPVSQKQGVNGYHTESYETKRTCAHIMYLNGNALGFTETSEKCWRNQ